MPRRKNINPQAVANLKSLIDEKGLSLQKFADSLERRGYSTSPQNVHRYVSGENEIPAKFANEVARVWGVNASWILGISPYKTPVDESVARIGELNTRNMKKRLLLDLMADMSGWIVEERHTAAPFGESESQGITSFVALTKDGTRHELDLLDYERLIAKMLDFFDFELMHM